MCRGRRLILGGLKSERSMLAYSRWDLLISHHVADRPYVTHLLERLVDRVPEQYRVMLDGWEHRPGEHLNLPLEEQLTLTRHALLILTWTSLRSGWDVLSRTVSELRHTRDDCPTLLLSASTLSPEDLPNPTRAWPVYDLRDGPALDRELDALVDALLHGHTRRPEGEADQSAVPGTTSGPPGSSDAVLSSDPPSPPGNLLSTHRSRFGSRVEDQLAGLQAEGLQAYREKRLEDARASFERGYTNACTLFGLEHPRTGAALNNLAICELELGNVDRAEALLSAAVGPIEQHFGPSHPVVVDMKGNLAAVALERSELPKARSLQETAIAGAVAAQGADYVPLAPHFQRLGTIATAQGDLPLAWTAYQRALALLDGSAGPEHPETAAAHDGLGSVAFAMGRLESAREHLEAAFQTRGRTLGSHHSLTLQTRERLARVARAQGDLATAHHLLEGLVEAYEERWGEHDVRLADGVDALAAVTYLMGESESAYRLIDRARSLKEIAFGPEDPRIAEALYHQARVARDMHNLGAARRHLERARRILEATQTADSPDLAAVLNDLGLCYLEQGELLQAKEPLERALYVWEKAPLTRRFAATALYNLAALSLNLGDRTAATRYSNRARALEAELDYNA